MRDELLSVKSGMSSSTNANLKLLINSDQPSCWQQEVKVMLSGGVEDWNPKAAG